MVQKLPAHAVSARLLSGEIAALLVSLGLKTADLRTFVMHK